MLDGGGEVVVVCCCFNWLNSCNIEHLLHLACVLLIHIFIQLHTKYLKQIHITVLWLKIFNGGLTAAAATAALMLMLILMVAGFTATVNCPCGAINI